MKMGKEEKKGEGRERERERERESIDVVVELHEQIPGAHGT
mgnify:CR=1 FL=1